MNGNKEHTFSLAQARTLYLLGIAIGFLMGICAAVIVVMVMP